MWQLTGGGAEICVQDTSEYWNEKIQKQEVTLLTHGVSDYKIKQEITTEPQVNCQ